MSPEDMVEVCVIVGVFNGKYAEKCVEVRACVGVLLKIFDFLSS
jgi:hypothetical protein